MPKKKKKQICIKNIHKVPVNLFALEKLIQHYYDGVKNIEVNFDNRLSAWGEYYYVSIKKTHYITISPKRCSQEQIGFYKIDPKTNKFTQQMTELEDYDKVCRIIVTLLHEIKHALQCDENPKKYAKSKEDRHPNISNFYLKYKLSKLEALADGWALINFNEALEKYDKWCKEHDQLQCSDL